MNKFENIYSLSAYLRFIKQVVTYFAKFTPKKYHLIWICRSKLYVVDSKVGLLQKKTANVSLNFRLPLQGTL